MKRLPAIQRSRRSRAKLSLMLCAVAALSATLFAGAPPTSAYADETVYYDLGQLGASESYHCNDPSKIYCFYGTTNCGNIVVDKNKGSEDKPIRIVLAGVNIDQSNSSYQQPGIDLKHGSYAQITVEENTSLAGSRPTNIIKGFKGEGGPVWNDQGHAAINVDYAAHLTLTVNSSDAAGNTPELACYGGQNSAGIGGSDDKSGEIEIHMNGGDLLSYGGSKGAGIGGGNDSDDHKYIRIYGHGSIDAEGATNGGVNGCGIGSGEGAKGDEITIIGDNDKSLEPQGRSLTIKAYGEGNNAAIGFGQDDGNTITIENCIVTAMNSDTSFAACIGTGRATYAKGDEGLKVSITNCDIKTKGSKYSTGIGAGYDGAVKSIESLNSTYEGLNIGSGEITGKGGNAGHVHLISICNSTVNANANHGASGGNNETARPRAGIGSGPWANVGKIEITGHSHVTATGTKNAAGIGTGGVPDDFGTALWLNGGISYQTNIVDSEVTATGGAGGAGIGGGKASRASSIYIQGSTVTATAGESECGGAGIGGGFRDGLDNITIGSSKVTATGAGGAAGIGTGGNNGELIGNIDGRIHVGYVFITNGSNVTATGGKNGAGIGSGWGAYIGTGDTQGISINNSAVHAQGGMHGAGIGGGADGPDANTGDGDLNQLYIGGTCQIEAYGGKGAAGIGGGFDGFAENLVFDLATDVAGNESGNLTHNSYVKAVGGAGAAGIGAGACDNYTGNDVDGITINGGYIEAVGGGDYKHEDVAHGTGAGIGGGEAGGSLHNLTVNGGYIKASSPDAHANGTGCGIGHGGNTNSSLPNSSDSNIRINGGTFDVQSWSDECDIVVDGGTFITPIKAGNHTVKNSNGQKLYRTTMYIEGFPAYQAAGGRVSITSDKSYGLVDAYTDNAGGLYYMLPESGDMQQTADCDGYRHYSGTTSTDDKGILKMSTSVDLVCEGEQVVGGEPFTIRLRDDSGWPGANIEWEFANGKEMFEVENHQDTCPGAFITLKAVKAGTYTVKAHLTSSSTDGGFNKLYWGAEGSYAHSINTFDTSIHFLNDPSKVYDGEPIDNPVVECINPATPVIDYKTPNGKYTSDKPTDAGTYTVRARVPESWPYPAATDTMDITVSQRPITFTADSIQESSESKHQGKTGFVAHINNLVTKVGTVTVTAAEDGRDEQTRTYNASDLEKENGGYCLFVDVADFNLEYKTTFTVSYASGTGNYTTTDPVTVDYDLPENDEPPVITKLDRTLKMQGEGSRYGDDKYRSYVVLSTNYPVAKGGLKMEVVQDVAYGNISEVAKEAPTVTLPASENIEFTEKKSSPGTYEARINPTILNAGRSTVRFTIAEQNADAENTVIGGAESQYTFDIMQAGLSTQVNVNDANQTTVTYGKTDDLTYSLDQKQLDISLKWGDTAEDILSLGNDVNGNKVAGYSASVTAEKLPEHAGAGTYTVGLLRQGADATVNGTKYQNVFYSRNYWLTTAKEATVTVKKAQITLRANDATGSIGHEPTYSYTSSGIAPWETESAVLVKDTKAALSDDKAYADLTAGTYENAITVKNAALAKKMDTNYESDIKVQDGTLTINKAAYEGTLTVRSKTYDGAPLTATYEVIDTATGKLVEDADKVQLTYAKKGADDYGEASAIAPTDAGTYRVTLSVAGDASHDELKLQKTATIDKASAPRIVVNDAEGEFGGKEPTYTYEVEGLVGNDQADDVVTAKAVLDTKVTGGSYDTLAAGTYPAAITAKQVGLKSDNYQDDVKIANGTLYVKVHEVQLEPSVTVSNKVYDGKPVEAKTSVKGYAEGDEHVGTLTYYDLSGDEPRVLTGAPTEAGSYRAEFAVADSTNAAGTVNYRGDAASCDFQIKRAAAPVLAAQPAHMAYHQSAPTLAYTISGLVEGDGQDKVFVSEPAPAAVIDTAKTDGKPASELGAGTYQDAVTVANVALTEFGARNYKTPRVATASLTVTKAQLALSLNVDNKVYDGEEVKPEYTATDPATGGAVEVKGEVSYVEVTNDGETAIDGAPKDTGTYRVTYTVPDTANYLGGSVSQKVRIYRAIPNPESPALEPIKFHEGLMASEEPFPEQPEDGTWSWTRRVKNQKVENPGVVTALAMFEPKDTRNYATVYRNLTFVVYEGQPSEPKRLELSITAENKTYDGQPYSDSLVKTKAVDADTGEPVEVKGHLTYYPVKKNDDRDDPWLVPPALPAATRWYGRSRAPMNT